MDAYDEFLNKAQDYVKSYNPNETVNYNDQRLLDVKSEQSAQEANINKNYDNMINSSDKFYQDQINASKQYAEEQSKLQQQNTDFAIEKINQEKEQAEKDYTKEQKASYVDYQKQSNQYGVNAEQMATAGLRNSGYSESSLVSMYNTYQNRVATARDGFNRALLNYNNSIKEAQLANNSKLAEIAYNALQQQLDLSLQGFQYKNNLVEAKINQINANNTRYDNKYENVLSQINKEINNRQNLYNVYSDFINKDKQMTEEHNQFMAQMEQKEKDRQESRRQWEAEFAEKQRQWQAEYDLAQSRSYSNSYSVSDGGYLVSDNSQTASPNYSRYESAVNTIIRDLNGQYKNNSENFKQQARQKIADKLMEAESSGILTEAEAESLYNRLYQ